MENNKSDWYNSTFRTNQEYIEEINTLLQPLENYKLRWFYKIIKGIVEIKGNE